MPPDRPSTPRPRHCRTMRRVAQTARLPPPAAPSALRVRQRQIREPANRRETPRDGMGSRPARDCHATRIPRISRSVGRPPALQPARMWPPFHVECVGRSQRHADGTAVANGPSPGRNRRGPGQTTGTAPSLRRNLCRTTSRIAGRAMFQSLTMVLPALAPEARSWISVTSSTGMTAGFLVPFSSATLTWAS